MCTTPKKSVYRLDRFTDYYTNDLDSLHKALKQVRPIDQIFFSDNYDILIILIPPLIMIRSVATVIFQSKLYCCI